ncbi:heterokaryon incompatibility protein-domain-containing protein [Cercophora samala]|uniref:Heterokaryon incompatibility protein-domain-containing protein n=1 Tax=Cercophora samala TaxID=330535 RepID=A0AA40DD32_9PEZI|nr:heterokaryon incompatibility protein-domain-containing protein [Cercophora samala]
MSAKETFTYSSPLLPGEIRLLSLVPSSPTLNFRLITSPLSSPIPYLALSYVWGVPKASSDPSAPTILIDGQLFIVTPNLHSALTSLLTPELQSGLPIWVDAVCINQLDNLEKEDQIKQMDQVYRNSERVIVHLGDSPDPETAKAVQQLRRIGKKVWDADAFILREADMQHWPTFDHLDDQPEERRKRVAIRDKIFKMIKKERGGVTWPRPKIPASAALDLFHRPWFGRAWVIQELVMAPVHDRGDGGCVFAVGAERIRWEYLWAAHLFLCLWFMSEAKSIGNAKTYLGKLIAFGVYVRRTGMFPRAFSARAAQTLGLRKKYLQGELGLRMKDLLLQLYVGDSGGLLGCRDPEDKINALRGMASDGEMLDKFMTPGANWEDVYTSLARYLYEQGDLGFLGLCRQRSPRLPSWVPDWSQQLRPPWLGYTGDMGMPLYNAGGGTKVEVLARGENGRILVVKGYALDTIQDVGSLWVSDLADDFNWESAKLRIDDIDRFLSISQRYVPQNARWRIITADKEANDVAQQRRATSVAQESFTRLESAARSYDPGSGSLGAWFFTYRNVLMSLYGSRAFISNKGYVGLCPGTADLEDTIFIPSGSHCPYIIRKQAVPASASNAEERWTLLGEAYVHGIMDGELELGAPTWAITASMFSLA